MVKAIIVGMIILGWVASMSGVDASEKHTKANANAKGVSATLKGDSIYHLDATWTNQDNVEVAVSSFRGSPVVATLVFTGCKAACPIITADLKKIEAGLPEEIRKEVMFLMFSMDHKKDTPEQLKKFAVSKDLDPKQWTLLHGSEEEVREMAAVLDVQYQEDANGGFAHSNVISVISREGSIQHRQVGLRQDPAGSVATLKKMVQD